MRGLYVSSEWADLYIQKMQYTDTCMQATHLQQKNGWKDSFVRMLKIKIRRCKQ